MEEKIKLLLFSDLHGHLIPKEKLEKADLCLISGDICPHFPTYHVGDSDDCFGQSKWLSTSFKPWIDSLPVDKTYFCWGNHDWVGEKDYLLPSFANPINKINCVQDDFIIYKGLKIWFSPWSNFFFNWAFNAPESDGEKWLENLYKKIPNDTDIIVSHGPCHGFGDLTPRLENVGSIALYNRILEINPKLLVVGHIHNGVGEYKVGNTVIINASVVNEKYKLINNGTIIEI